MERLVRSLARFGVLLAMVSSSQLTGCSFVAVEDIDPDMTTDPADCTALNAEASLATGDACLTWQLVEGFCRIGSRDTDGDGAKDPDCAAADEVVDCDPEDGTRAPNLAELCDGIDNDCDERVDEDVLSPTSPSDTQVATGIENLALASPSLSARAAALFTSPMGTPQNVVTTARFATSGSGTVAVAGASVTAPARDGTTRGTTALAALDSQSYVAALIPAGGCRAPVLATLGSESAATDLVFPVGHLAAGLPNAAAETCASAVDPALLRARSPALGASATRALTAWVAGAFIDSCGVPADDAPVLVNGASFNAGSRVLTPSGSAAVTLGDTDDAAAPAVVRVSADRFVVAHADGGALVLSLVAVASDGSVTLLDSATHDLGGTSAGDLAVAVLDGGDVVVAYRLGCGTQARVMVARTTLDVVAGSLADTLSTPQAIEAGTSAQRRPRIAVREFPVGATVAWEASNSIRVRQLDAAGQPLGAVLAGYAATGTLRAGHHLYPLPDSPAFGLIISDTSSNGTGALASLELRCAL
ncbi:MAG: hypothetical protein IPG81_23750 [Sandaracinaceae bacterium]|nr:hypothetical protein [Sandaracinaceae bacterium]